MLVVHGWAEMVHIIQHKVFWGWRMGPQQDEDVAVLSIMRLQYIK